MTEKILQFLSTQRPYVIELQREMTSLPAIGPDNGGMGEEAKALYLEHALKTLGITDILHIDAPDLRVAAGKRPNIAARVPGREKKTLWVMGHMDIVPPGDQALWSNDPYTLTEDGDLLIGRGVEDNQQAIASALLAAKTLYEMNLTPRLSLGILLLSDEETHSNYGLQYVVDMRPDLIKQEDLVLIPDSGDPLGETIEVAEKGALWLKFTVKGRQCHASLPGDGINSLVAASACVLSLLKLHELFPQQDPMFMPPHSTFVSSKKEANVGNINTVPGLDVFYMDCRILHGVDPEEVRQKAAALVNAAAASYGATVEVETVYVEKPTAPTPLNSPIVTALKKSLHKLRGIEAKPIGIGGQTVAAVLRRQGIPAAVWGTLLKNPHTPNERSSIANTIADAAVIVDMLLD